MLPNLRILLEEASTSRQPNNGLTRQQKVLSKGLADVAMRKQRHSYHHATPSTQGALPTMVRLVHCPDWA